MKRFLILLCLFCHAAEASTLLHYQGLDYTSIGSGNGSYMNAFMNGVPFEQAEYAPGMALSWDFDVATDKLPVNGSWTGIGMTSWTFNDGPRREECMGTAYRLRMVATHFHQWRN